MMMRTLSWWQSLWNGFLNLTSVYWWLSTYRITLPKKIPLNFTVLLALRHVSHHILTISSLFGIDHYTSSFLYDWILRGMDQITSRIDNIFFSFQVAFFSWGATSLATISSYFIFYSRETFLAALVWLWRGYLSHLSAQIVAYIKGQTIWSLRTLLWRH